MTKKSILRPLCGAALVAAAALFAGCSDVYTGGDADSTTVSFAGAEAKYTQPEATGELESIANIKYFSSSIEQAAEDSIVELTFTAKTRLDEESIKTAVTFYTLTENEISAGTRKIYAYPQRSTPLPSSLRIYVESVNTKIDPPVSGTARFSVNTSTVTNGLIAVMVDAAKLKDKRGNFVLNGDGNETAGEESDSWIDYITVYKDKDGNGYDGKQLRYDYPYKEDFAPSYLNLDGGFLQSEWSAASKLTGKYQVIVGPVRDGYASEFAADGKDVYDVYKTELASTLAGIYSVQVKKADETSWTDKSLTFSYQSSDDYGFYVATTETLSAGDQIRLVKKTPTKTTAGLSDTTNATKLFGHPAYVTYNAKSYTFYVDEETSSYHATEPSYIVQGATDKSDFEARNYDYDDIRRVQKDFFTKWERIGTNWLISLRDEELAFGATDGFKVVLNKEIKKKDDTTGELLYTDSAYTELNATITEIGKRTVLIELPSYYNPDGIIELWVGSGTTLTTNPAHPKQTTFGSFADVSKGVVSGYVKITELPRDVDLVSTDWNWAADNDPPPIMETITLALATMGILAHPSLAKMTTATSTTRRSSYLAIIAYGGISYLSTPTLTMTSNYLEP